jgi:hypothetical protein
LCFHALPPKYKRQSHFGICLNTSQAIKRRKRQTPLLIIPDFSQLTKYFLEDRLFANGEEPIIFGDFQFGLIILLA